MWSVTSVQSRLPQVTTTHSKLELHKVCYYTNYESHKLMKVFSTHCPVRSLFLCWPDEVRHSSDTLSNLVIVKVYYMEVVKFIN